jgi:hypothetical protein
VEKPPECSELGFYIKDDSFLDKTLKNANAFGVLFQSAAIVASA